MVCLEESKDCSEERQISAHLRGEKSEVHLQLFLTKRIKVSKTYTMQRHFTALEGKLRQ